jgi:hypothetical protein
VYGWVVCAMRAFLCPPQSLAVGLFHSSLAIFLRGYAGDERHAGNLLQVAGDVTYFHGR